MSSEKNKELDYIFGTEAKARYLYDENYFYDEFDKLLHENSEKYEIDDESKKHIRSKNNHQNENTAYQKGNGHAVNAVVRAKPKKKIQTIPGRRPDIYASVQNKNRVDGISKAINEANLKSIKAYNKSFRVVLYVCISVIMLMSVFYVRGTVKVSKLRREISSLYENKINLIDAVNALESEIDKEYNLDDVKKYAEEKLGMIDPKDSRKIYYDNESGDYLKRY